MPGGSRDGASSHVEFYSVREQTVPVRRCCPIGRDHRHEEWLERFTATSERRSATKLPNVTEWYVCTRCGLRAEAVANPLFGTGLAVHEHLIVCEQCGYTNAAGRLG